MAATTTTTTTTIATQQQKAQNKSKAKVDKKTSKSQGIHRSLQKEHITGGCL